MATPEPARLSSTRSTGPDQHVRMSYEEYRAWAGEDVHAEWVNGEVIVQMPPKEPHRRVVAFLTALLTLFIQLFQLGRLFPAPFEMRAIPGGPAHQPDLLFVAREHLDRITEDRLNGPADLVVEVISDDSVARDRADKFYEYQAAGVREYWILDPRSGYERADFYVLDEHGRYRPVPVDPAGRYQSTVLPGFWLQVDWVLSVAPPDVLNALTQVVGPEKLVEAIRTSGPASNAESPSTPS
ncbi:MAG TPA: Uma2 family endonuclease [Alphaproteobacteria bacterium]|nr:Uma2 family endonuclease [Alphaproteobacteria bacterium]